MSPQAAAKQETSAEKQIRRAQELERQRGELMRAIGSNREYLRLMAENDELNDDELDFVEDYYPQKEKGQKRSDDEITRTRLVKAAARAGATTVAENRALREKVAANANGDDDDDE